jgi:hypothetical protein
MEVIKIKISPEVLKYDIRPESYSGFSFGYYSGLTEILSGGTGGSSLLTDVSIPVFFKQNYSDIGYYSPFDGDLTHCSENVNFTFILDSLQPNGVCILNTSKRRVSYLSGATYYVDWGDGSAAEEVINFIPGTTCHNYLVEGTYTISFSGSSLFGLFIVKKNVTIPLQVLPYFNSDGNVIFPSNYGSWSGSPTSQDYIYFFDSNNTVSQQISSVYTNVPILITGSTKSRLEELQVYGANPYVDGLMVTLQDGATGMTLSQSVNFTAYTINDQTYLDYPNGTSMFYTFSQGLTSEMLTASALTKFEYLMNIIEQPEIQSYVFIERGKYSGMENFKRIGEINNVGSLRKYGLGFFDVRNWNDI